MESNKNLLHHEGQKKMAEFYLNNLDEVSPSLMVNWEDKEKQSVVIPIRFSSPEEKMFLMMVARRFIMLSKASSYTFAAEIQAQGTEEGNADYKEWVLFASHDGTNEKSDMWDINRPDKKSNDPITVSLSENINKIVPLGMMENLFDTYPYNILSVGMKKKVDAAAKKLML
jgi:hypothetical protein